MENFEIASKRGKEKYFSEGFLYVFDKNSTCLTKKFWRCDQKNHNCKARIHTHNGNIILRVNEHNHDSSAAKVEAQKVVTSIKKRAAETMEATGQVINSCIADLTQGAQVALPRIKSLKKMVRRQRQELRASPAAPTNLETLEIPEEYQIFRYGNGQQDNFLLCDSGPSQDRILIFGRQENIKILKESGHWFVDGTFRSASQLFSQVYVILAKRFGGVHPIIYAMLPNKQQRTYEMMLQLLKQLEPDLNPPMVSCDFELAAINAFKGTFRNAQIIGCFFHLTKNIKKQLANFNLLRQYNNDANFALKSRMITSLAFVPIDNLDAAVEELEIELPQELQPLLQWFEDNYIGRPNRRGNGRRPALFPPSLWSTYQRVLSDTDRTNNYAEAAHRRMQTELGMGHPVLWKFIEELKKIQHGRDLELEQLIAGGQPVKKLNKYLRADQNIKNIVQDFRNREIVDYLRGIAHNFQMDP